MEPPSKISVSIVNESDHRVRTSRIRAGVLAVLNENGIGDVEVCILLSSDDRIRELNRRFRGIDEPTDVLTFPSGLDDGALGDIAIAVPYADRQAKLRGVPLWQEVAFLAIHGALHLVGQDDELETDRAEMVRRMNLAAVAANLQPDEEWASLLHEESAA